MAFLTAGSVDLEVALPPLLTHRISVHAVRFVAPGVHVERLPTTEQLDLHRTGGNAVDARRRARVSRPLPRCLRRSWQADVPPLPELLGGPSSIFCGPVRQPFSCLSTSPA
jgi:hypothetical protein